MCKRVNDLMKDSEETLGHMDVCLGKALFEVVSSCDTNTKKGRNELFNPIRPGGAQRPGWPNSQLPIRNLLSYDAQTW